MGCSLRADTDAAEERLHATDIPSASSTLCGLTKGSKLRSYIIIDTFHSKEPQRAIGGGRGVGCVCVFRSGLAFGGVCACPLSACPLCPVPGVSAVACPSSRVSCPGVEILGYCTRVLG